ncbi:ArnT family glycosyltransferase [Micromonospora sp. NBC_00898]|uniref:ArnT family glycosyltransferase n=1 Tax=Micromonospora sp. NBC_00898 TaxID=2975981 RepID=UPI00386B655E
MSTPVQDGRWRPRLDRPAFVALLLGLAGVAYRLVLILFTLPGSNSDEATFGLAAMHIAAGRDRPVFLYGQHYMGMLESYLAAPLIGLAGPSWPVLRLPVLALYAIFLWLMYRLSRRLCSPWFAVLVVGLLALGSERVVRDQLTVVGGRPEVKPAVVAMLLIAVALAERRVRHRWLATGLFGLLAGVALWSDWLIVPYLAVAGLLLVWAAPRDLVGWPGVLLVAGFLLGVSPMIKDNLVAPDGQDSLSVFREISTKAGPTPPWSDRLRGGLLEGVPLASGLCPVDGCARWQQWFGLLYPLLLVAAAVLAVVAYRRADRVRAVAQLALVAGAVLTLLAYVHSPLAATDPLGNSRYLSVLQVSLPAVLWPLWLAAARSWRGAAATAARPGRGGAVVARRVGGAAATVALVALAGTALAATARFVADAGSLRAEEGHARELADAVRGAGLREVYGDYWTCNRLTFNTGEAVVCGVLDGNLTPGQNRYPAYWKRVGRAARPGYVVPVGSSAERGLRRLIGDRADAAVVAEVGGYRVYHPETAVRPWR